MCLLLYRERFCERDNLTKSDHWPKISLDLTKSLRTNKELMVSLHQRSV